MSSVQIGNFTGILKGLSNLCVLDQIIMEMQGIPADKSRNFESYASTVAFRLDSADDIIMREKDKVALASGPTASADTTLIKPLAHRPTLHPFQTQVRL